MSAATEPNGAFPSIRIRSARPEDEAAVVSLLTRTLGWADDSRHHLLFRWKHTLNPFGPSPGWVAEDDQGIVGFRALMRWEFKIGDEMVRAVRAVDTATEPRAQGRGIFRALTLRAVEEMTAEGISFVFNTPNPSSAPGYLSMGWCRLGRLPASFRICGLKALPKMASARQPGELWSLETSSGEDAKDVLRHREGLSELLAATATDSSDLAIHTNRTPEFLQWRYANGPVTYRALLAGPEVRHGILIFRLRRRGPAVEAVIADTLIPRSDPKAALRLRENLVRSTEADYALSLGRSRPRRWLPVPGGGPVFTWRALEWEGRVPDLTIWDVTTGDIELF